MASTVILPPSQRRFRHVEQFLARNLPASSNSAGPVEPAASYFTLSTVDGKEFFRSKIASSTQNPVWEPLPVEAAQFEHTRFIFSLLVSHTVAPMKPASSDPNSDFRLAFELIMDLGRMHFVAKSIGTLYELSSLPAHTPEKDNALVVLVKCCDGVFYPSMLQIAHPSPKVQTPSGPLPSAPQETDTWDIVDMDVLREEEKRQQRTDPMTIGDLKCYSSATIMQSYARRALLQKKKWLREHIASMLQDRASGAEKLASESASKLRCQMLRQEIRKRAQEVDLMRQEVAQRKLKLEERAKKVKADTAAVEAGLKRRECANKRAELKAALQQLSQRRAQALIDIYDIFPIEQKTICGLAVPDVEPENEEHAMALGHVAHVLMVFCSIHGISLPHPVYLCASRSYICESQAAKDKKFALFPRGSGERVFVRKAIALLQRDIMCAALAVHKQKQADGLPLLMGIQKLIENR